MPAPLPPLTPDVAAEIARKDPALSRNVEPGFANMYGPGSNVPEGRNSLLIPAAGVGALGLYLLYRKRQQDLDDVEKQALDMDAIMAQAPGLHAPDLILGGTAGVGAGLLYDYLRGAPKGKRFSSALRRALIGAAVGAGATNLAGDRFRRYVTNSIVPAGYDSGNILQQLKPRSFEHVRDALIYDKPSHDPEAVKKFIASVRGNKDVGDRIIAARRELKRIGFGVDRHNPGASFWQKNPGKNGPAYYSVNEKNPEYLANLRATMLPARLDPTEVPALNEFFRNPISVEWLNSPSANGKALDPTATQAGLDLFGVNSLLGGQQLVSRQNGNNVDVTVLDRDDVTASKADKKHLADAFLKGNIINSTWRQALRENPEAGATGQTNAQAVNSTFARMLWDRVLSKENPWVSQKFRFSPLPGALRSPTDTPEYGMQLLNEAGKPVMEVTQPQLYKYLGGQ